MQNSQFNNYRSEFNKKLDVHSFFVEQFQEYRKTKAKG
jgi:hypothetical protein